MKLEDLHVKIFADGADLTSIRQRAALPYIKGFTTNPTLMRKAGVEDYERWARAVLDSTDKPISFEVLADDFDEMERQARKIATWGNNVYVKIPITNTRGDWSSNVIRHLVMDGIKVNVTAITTLEQVRYAMLCFPQYTYGILSIFAGRIADAGCPPTQFLSGVYEMHHHQGPFNPCLDLLWASCREVYNILEADGVGCDIVTVPDKILCKLEGLGKDLNQVSLDTVKQFHDDAVAAGYTL